MALSIFNSTEKGFSFVELLFSLALSAMVITSVIFLFFSVKKAYLNQEGLAYLQENARSLSTIFKNAITHNGDMGCNHLGSLTLTFHEGVFSENLGLTHKKAITGILPIEFRAFGSAFLKQRREDSDSLWVKSMTDFRIPELTVNEHQRNFVLKGKTTIQKGDILALTDCSHADFFKVREEPVYFKEEGKTEIEVSEYGSAMTTSKVYDKSARLGLFHSTLYYVGKTSRLNSQGQAIYALYRKTQGERTQELLEGVESLKILFGVKMSNHLVYKQFHEVVAPDKIVSVQIQALLSTVEPVLVEQLNLKSSEHKADGKIRKWFHYEWQI